MIRRWRRRTKTKLTPRRRQRLLETSGGSEQRTIINGNTVIGDGDTTMVHDRAAAVGDLLLR